MNKKVKKIYGENSGAIWVQFRLKNGIFKTFLNICKNAEKP